MKLELMSPAGSINSLIAAIDGGANSVYLGLNKFNARRPAKNFTPYLLKKAVRYAHNKNVKVYLTLNIDLKSNELLEACEIIQLCCEINIDAVIIKDFSLLNIINKFFKNKIKTHLSTQCAISNSYGVDFASSYNVERVVLARELTINEIGQCCQNKNTHIEIFTEGSMCFSISGRCLMSSFVGGRSGNRGACTGCCRIGWIDNKNNKKSYFSMKDLSLLEQITALNEAGVTSIKIEGRLKNSNWVKIITAAYRKAIDNDGFSDLKNISQELSKYSAREIHNGHLFNHSNLLGDNRNWDNYVKTDDNYSIPDFFNDSINVKITVSDKVFIKIFFREKENDYQIDIPSSPKKAKLIPFNILKEKIKQEFRNYQISIDIIDENFCCSSSFITNIIKKISDEIKKIEDTSNQLPQLKENVIDFIKQTSFDRNRGRQLGEVPDKIIILHNNIRDLLNYNNDNLKTVSVVLNPDIDINIITSLSNKYKIIISIPEVIYEKELPSVEDKIKELYKTPNIGFEANSYSGLQLIQNYNGQKYTGPGLSVMNHIAPSFFKEIGYKSCYATIEGDKSVYRSLSSFANIDIELIVFGRTPLFISRADEPFFYNNKFTDKYVEITPHKIGELFYFVSKKPYSLIGKEFFKDCIFFDSLTADLRFYNNPIKIINDIYEKKINLTDTNDFNYNRKLV